MDIQSIEQLRERFNNLNEKKAKANALLEKAKEELQKLQAEAKGAFGTDDLNQLEQMLQKMERENEMKRLDYQKLLDSIESELREVDKAFSEPQ